MGKGHPVPVQKGVCSLLLRVFGTNPTMEKEGRYGITRVYGMDSDYSKDRCSRSIANWVSFTEILLLVSLVMYQLYILLSGPAGQGSNAQFPSTSC